MRGWNSHGQRREVKDVARSGGGAMGLEFNGDPVPVGKTEGSGRWTVVTPELQCERAERQWPQS